MEFVKKALAPILSATAGGLTVYYLKDPILSVLVLVPLILLIEYIKKKYDAKEDTQV